MPCVSVVIPSYNSARFVTVAVQSVLEQTISDLEVVVVDDGSTDDTRGVLKRYGPPFRYVLIPNGGVSMALNRGIAETSGKYVAFLDADDVWLPQKLDRQLAALRDSAGAEVCYTAYTLVDEERRPLGVHRPPGPEGLLEKLLFQSNVVGPPSTVLVERALLDRVGGFDPNLSQCADWDEWIRLERQATFVCVDEPLIEYRQHANNMSRSTALLERDSVRVLEKAFSDPRTPAQLRSRSNRGMGWNWMVLAGCYFRSNNYRDFARCLSHALCLDPAQAVRLLGYPFRQLSRVVRAT